jgi:hypothetical protein
VLRLQKRPHPIGGVDGFANDYRIVCSQLIKSNGAYLPAARALVIGGVNIEIGH